MMMMSTTNERGGENGRSCKKSWKELNNACRAIVVMPE